MLNLFLGYVDSCGSCFQSKEGKMIGDLAVEQEFHQMKRSCKVAEQR